MLALSLWRPWPWVIFRGGKDVENRSWPPPISAIGTRIALHSSKKWDADAFSFFIQLDLRVPDQEHQHPYGVVTGTAVIDRVVTETKTLTLEQRRFFFTERADGKQNYGWILADRRELERPVPCVGRQGLWALPADVERAVEDQLR